MFDASLIAHFPRPGTGADASVDEIHEAVTAWYSANPGYRGKPSKLAELMSKDGWTGWKSRGPELLAGCPYYRLGFLPAGTHGWNDTMAEYARTPCEVYEYGYHVGTGRCSAFGRASRSCARRATVVARQHGPFAGLARPEIMGRRRTTSST